MEESNLIILQGFKESCAVLFCKGALLKDPKGLLEKPGEKLQSARRIQFTSVREIVNHQAALKALIREAISAEKSGLKVVYRKITEHTVPEELQRQLEKHAALKEPFESLTPLQTCWQRVG